MDKSCGGVLEEAEVVTLRQSSMEAWRRQGMEAEWHTGGAEGTMMMETSCSRT